MSDVPNYITVEELKHSAEMTGFSFADYEFAKAVPAASRAVENITGRRFYLDDDTSGVRYYTPTEASSLRIDDLVTVGTVATDLDGNGVFETVWTENTDFVFEPLNAAVKNWPYDVLRVHPASSLRLPCWPRSVQVTGQFGWPEVPEGVFVATSILAARTVKRIREHPFPIMPFGEMAMRIARSDPEVQMHLEPYLAGGGVLAA